MDDLLYPCGFGPYELLGRLGRGAAGSAYLARPGSASVGVPTPVVIKRMHGELGSQPEFVRRFRHEAEIAVLVDSPHVARVFDVGAVAEEAYIALEYVPGWTLGRLLGVLNQRRRLSPEPVAFEVGRQFLTGLAALHRATDRNGEPLDVVHRDLSPKNLMVGDDGRVRIIDLGLGKSRAQDWQTRLGRVMGSPGYMPPEQISGQPVDQRADVYAAAVVLHELFTSERYISAGEPVSMLRRALEKPYAPVKLLRSDVPSELDRLLEQAMAPSPEARIRTVLELLHRFEHVFGARGGRAAAVAEWVRSTLPTEQSARRAEVRRLLAQPRLVAEEGPDVQATEVWVVREGVNHGATRVMAEPARTRLTPSPALSSPPSPRPKIGPAERPRLAFAMAAGVAVGVLATRAFDRIAEVSTEARGPTVPVRLETEGAPVLGIFEPGASAEPRPPPDAVAPEAGEEVDSTSAPPGAVSPAEDPGIDPMPRRAPRVEDPRPSPRRVHRAKSPAVEPLNERLEARASRLRQDPDPNIAGEANRLLARIMLAVRVPSTAEREAQLRAIDAELRALERARP